MPAALVVLAVLAFFVTAMEVSAAEPGLVDQACHRYCVLQSNLRFVILQTNLLGGCIGLLLAGRFE